MSLKPPELSLVSRVIIAILVSLLVILATFGNIAVIYLLSRGRKGIRNRSISSVHKPSLTRHSVTCTFLLNLSVADLLHILLCAPFTLVADFLLIHWPFGQILCRLVSYLQGVVVFLCAFTHIVLSLDRLVAIQCPIWRRRNLSSNNARLIILGIWLCAMTIPIPSLIVCQVLTLENGLTYCQEVWPHDVINQSINLTYKFSGLAEALANSTSNNSFGNIFSPLEVSYSLILLLFQYVIPLVVITSTYSAIVYRVWGSPPPGEGNVQRDEKRCASKKKLIKMVICVATLYAVSQLPRHIVYLVTMNSPNAFERETMMYVWLFCHLSTWSATGYNPFIYAWMNRAFRRGLLDLLHNIFCFYRTKRIFGRRRHIVREPGPSTLVEFEPMNTDANACDKKDSCTDFDPDC